MRALGELWMQDGKGGPGSGAMRATNAASAAGYVLAAELRACGVDLSFTPVLDLDHGPSTVIGDRAFARDPRVVSLLAKSLMHGLLRAGMSNCGKHFPGHGFRHGRLAHRHPGGPAQPQGNPRRGCRTVWLAQHHARTASCRPM
jgi:beta-N-acetylhexosaminidase